MVIFSEFRKKLDRWELSLPIPKGHVENRAHLRLATLKGKVSHAVLITYFRTLSNGWPTARRMRHLHNVFSSPKCLFCKKAEDSLEHLPFCSTLAPLYHRHRVQASSLAHFLGIILPPDTLHICSVAKVITTVFLARNVLVHSNLDIDIPALIRATETSVFKGRHAAPGE